MRKLATDVEEMDGMRQQIVGSYEAIDEAVRVAADGQELTGSGID